MRITKIEIQKKRSNRFSVFIDGLYSFSLSDLELANSGLREGDELSLGEFGKWKDHSEFGKAMNLAFRYLSYRPRTEQEVSQYLKRREISDDIMAEVLGNLRGNSYIDDRKFTEIWVNDRQSMQPRSKRHLRIELIQKGIGSDIIDEFLSGVDDHFEIRAIKNLVHQKRLLGRYLEDRKLIAYLVGRGFSYGHVKQAMKELEDEDSSGT